MFDLRCSIFDLRSSTFDLSPNGTGHRLAGNPAGGPCRLKIEAAGDAIDIEQFAGEVEPRTDAAFHRLEVHFCQPHTAARDAFIVVQALSRHRVFSANQSLDEPMLAPPRQ